MTVPLLDSIFESLRPFPKSNSCSFGLETNFAVPKSLHIFSEKLKRQTLSLIILPRGALGSLLIPPEK